ncbi:MAG: hypothetical protein AAF501_13430, partial [Pseudomonadota bacterium]
TGCTLEQFADLMKSFGFRAERGERPKVLSPQPVEKDEVEVEPADADAPEADADAPAAVPEGSGEPVGAAPDAPSEPEDDATSTDAPSVPDSQTSPAARPVDPTDMIEVFYTFTVQRRPDGRGGRNRDDAKEKRGHRSAGKPAQDQRKHRPKGPKKGPKDGSEPKKNRSSGPKGRDKPVDPDNPFAILQQLKKP